MKYKYTKKESSTFNKYGIDITVYEGRAKTANISHVSCKEGHLQEFKQKKSTFIYYIVKGDGIFVLNDEKVKVKATDLVVIPPETRIHYFGTMEMVLTVTPAFDPKNEVHVRMIDKSENPLRDIKK